MPMRTTFRGCFLVNFAVDPAAMRARLPAHLEPELHEGRAYLSIVIADMARMRPAKLENCEAPCVLTFLGVLPRPTGGGPPACRQELRTPEG